MIEVQNLPYPQGLGKDEYPSLKSRMQHLLGNTWSNQDVNKNAFWTLEYQTILHEELSAGFDRAGRIEDIVRDATELAQTVAGFAQGAASVDESVFNSAVPAKTSNAYELWLRDTPILGTGSDGTTFFVDGRHRTSYLRSFVQQRDPSFPVLVRFAD
ncbi:hypothetical protein [Gordonia sihwensis]|uniref:hypothetical protein n=1 Tax=Gordonia sihwensis TaxID=173559 RepID=UPI0012E0A8D1|nr:hypothetical protein [Gordonia sihwensis]